MGLVYDELSVQLYQGDCLTVLASMPGGSVDSVVTDPPAGIAFMGRSWDGDRGGRDQWIPSMFKPPVPCSSTFAATVPVNGLRTRPEMRGSGVS